MSKWIRHRFHANEDDPRPVKFPPPGPWWHTGSGDGYSTVVAYLPPGVDVTSDDLWPEAAEIDSEGCEEIMYTSRFPRPSWWSGE